MPKSRPHVHVKRIPKLSTGIPGFDEISDGGIPYGRTTLVVGGPGTGKTVFALQTLVHGAREHGESGIFVAFEESSSQIAANARTFGWDLAAIGRRKLFILDAQLPPDVVQTGQFDLSGMLELLGAKVKELGATRIVFDGIDVLLTLLDDRAAERREIYRIRDWLRTSGLTAIVTQKIDSSGDQHEFLQFMTDCVVRLEHTLRDGSAERSLRVVKYRGSDCTSDEFPMTLGARAMRLAHQGPVELNHPVTTERVSTGLARLDHMLTGGYYRGSSVLLSGAPGTAKSTLCGLFAAAACARGERTLYVSFDEGAEQIVRNLRSVGINLEQHTRSGVLAMWSTRSRGPNNEYQLESLRERVIAHRARCLVIDPISAMSPQVTSNVAYDATQRFLDFLKREGVTVVNSSLMDSLGVDEASAAGISTIADTWIHLSYLVQDGERNRALTIVKARGTGHSNQVRELKLSDNGIDLVDVFVGQGKVLMGVARWEWEQQERARKKQAQAATALKRLQLKLTQAEAEAKAQIMKVEMEARTAEIDLLAETTGYASELLASEQAQLRMLRRADEDVRAVRKKKAP